MITARHRSVALGQVINDRTADYDNENQFSLYENSLIKDPLQACRNNVGYVWVETTVVANNE